MSMSKKDFIALAEAITEHNRIAERTKTAGVYQTAPFTNEHLDTLVRFCRSQNGNFMQGRWLDYIAGKCGKNGGTIKAK